MRDTLDAHAPRFEVTEAQKLFEREGRPTIDVSRRWIEETAASVLSAEAISQQFDLPPAISTLRM